ncbi:hypothetical protein ACWDG9_16635 [Streptomyces sp. NPDC001073]
MAVANRSSRLRSLAHNLTKHFGLPWGYGQIEAEYDETRREWTYVWVDGPTVEQVRREARKAQPEAVEDLKYERRLSDTVYALGVLRMTLAAEPVDNDFRGPHFLPREIAEYFAKAKNPAPKEGREATMVANLLKVSEEHGRNFWDAVDRVSDFVATNGFARALSGVELSPLELLTARYAQGPAERAWRRRLIPLTPLEAFSAVHADQEARQDAVDAALTLLPELHAALDAAAADLTARRSSSEATE